MKDRGFCAIKKLLPLILWINIFVINAQRQADFYPIATQNSSTMMGIGQTALTDTYLSPLKYKGVSFSLLHENLRLTGLFDSKMVLQQQFQLQTAFTKNATSTASEYFGEIAYNATGLYPFVANEKFRLLGGTGVNASLGGIYNARNSNNPGSLKSTINLTLSGMAIYNWRKFTFRYQVSTPLAGVFFSPAYGQSYYEIFSLGNDKGVVNWGSFHNQLSLRNYFTVDVPVGNLTIRGGYLGNYYRTSANDLKTIISSHHFVLGLVYETFGFAGMKSKDKSKIKSAYY